MKQLQLLFVACCIYLSSGSIHSGPLVHTKYGSLRGQYLRVRGKTTVVHSYLGIPFAKPPVGPLRLAPPQPAEGWEGVRDAATKPHMCLQDRHVTANLSDVLGISLEIPSMSEDCLYLNVYTTAKPNEDVKMPVMVYIHGGGFALGAASLYDGSALTAYQNVVVVTIQYRLGILGFFSTEDGNAPGNLGLLDQVAALQWVQDNIQSYGGDPSSVTIFGESAGGVSVSLQILSPLSSGLFHRGIAESGTAAMDAVIVSHPLATAMMAANVSNCTGTKPHELVDCVMQMSTEDILNLAENRLLIFGVTIDGEFLPKPIGDLLNSHNFHKVPLINGVNNDEFGWMMPSYLAPPGWEEGMDVEAVKQPLHYFLQSLMEHIDLILEEYLGNGEDRIRNRDAYREILADVVFNIPAIKLSNTHRESGAPVYMYEFQHPPSVLQSKRPDFVKVDHADETLFVFGNCFTEGHIKLTGSCTEEEDQLSKTVMAYWANFAKTGSPNGPGLPHWPMYGVGEEYLGIGLQQQVGSHLKAQRFTFLTQTLPTKVQEMKRQQQQSVEL